MPLWPCPPSSSATQPAQRLDVTEENMRKGSFPLRERRKCHIWVHTEAGERIRHGEEEKVWAKRGSTKPGSVML